MKNKLKVILHTLLPKGLISNFFGSLSRMEMPQWLLKRLMKRFCRKYNVVMEEFNIPAAGFKNFDLFFTRKLRPGIHKINSAANAVVSPVDGRVDQFGRMEGNMLMQAKGIAYSVEELVPSEMSRHFKGGDFITIYLSPSDYHRIHSPVTGKVEGYLSIPGELYTVQEFMVQGMKNLYAVNERVISYIKTDYGRVALCKIGAMGVGTISLTYNNTSPERKNGKREVLFEKTKQPILKKGGEAGIFHLGSTVIMIFQKGMIKFGKLSPGMKVRVGEKIGTILKG